MRVSVTDLLGRPGATRHVHESVLRADIDDEPDVWGPASETLLDPIVVDVDLDSVNEGVMVHGTIDVDMRLACSRCLVDQDVEETLAVAEMFFDPKRVEELAEDDYRIDLSQHELDLSPLLRDLIVMEVPVQLLCRPDCQGLCPQCGTNRNETDCGHRPGDDLDPRWASLTELKLPPG